MTTVYKYHCDRYGINILRDLELKITPPNQFNDPFEFTPRVICSNPARKIKDMLRPKATIKGMYLEDKSEGKFRGNFRQYREQFRKSRPSLIASAISRVPETMADVQKGYCDNISSQFGVLCVSARRDSILMWGHYCNKHRGLVIGFDSSHEFFKRAKGLRPVDYVRERVLYDSSWEVRGVAERKYRDQLIFSKNDEWAYEQELRQLFNLTGLKSRTLPDRKTIGYFHPIPPEAVVSVTLGAKCSSELEKDVQMVLNSGSLPHVKKPEHATLHERDFALKFE